MRTLRIAAVVASLWLLAGCAGRGPWTLAFPGELRPSVSNGEWIRSYAEIAANVGEVFQRDLGFPPFTATISFLPNDRAFEAALLESGYDAPLAAQTARTMTAIGGYRRVLVNEQKLAPLAWPARLALLAHELTHTLQYELGGGTRGASDQWLREGFAEWTSMRVLDRLRVVDAASSRAQKLRELRATSRMKAPGLEQMATFREFVTLAARRDIAPYEQAFVAVDLLVERHGLPAVIGYFERFATASDRAENFRAAFGEDLAVFEQSLVQRVWR